MMKKSTLPFQVAGIIFIVIAILHLLRVVLNVSVTVAGRPVPMGFSILATIGPLALAWWIFKNLADRQ